VVGGHSEEIEKRPRLIRETGIGDYGPRSQMYTRRKAETNSDSEKRPAKRQTEIERKANDKNKKSRFNQIGRLLEQVRSRDYSENAVFRGICGGQGSNEHQDDADRTDRGFAKTGQRGIGT
jgi:hypothetical protein